MSDLKIIATSYAPPAIGPYSQGIEVNGFLFFSGQIAFTSDGDFIDGTIEEQTEQVLKNIDTLLKAAGVGRQNVVKVTIFLKDMSNFSSVNKIYAGFFQNHAPARSTVAVAELPRGAKIEIEVVAMK